MRNTSPAVPGQHSERRISGLMDCVGRALAGAPSARPAAAFWMHHPVADQEVETFTKATLAFQREVGCDVVKLTPAGTCQATRFGLRDEWRGDAVGRRAIVHRPVHEPAQWRDLAGRGFGRQEEVSLATARAVREALGPDQPLIATVFSPASMAMQLAGGEHLAAHLLEASEELTFGLQVLAESVAALIGGFIEAGVDGIYYVDQHSAQPALARFTLWSLAHGVDARPLAAAADLPIRILHYHGRPLSHDLIPTAPVFDRCRAGSAQASRGLIPVADESISSTTGMSGAPAGWTLHFERDNGVCDPPSVSARLGARLALVLPLSGIVGAGDAPAKRDLVRRALQAEGLANALVTAPCVIPLDVSTAHLRAWMEAIREWP